MFPTIIIEGKQIILTPEKLADIKKQVESQVKLLTLTEANAVARALNLPVTQIWRLMKG